MMSDLREKILGCNDKQTKVVEVPEWGVTVYLESMTSGQASRLLSKAQDAAGNMAPDYFARLVVGTARDESGNLIFDEQDVPLLMTKNASPVMRIAKIVSDMCDFNIDAEALAEKN